MTGLRLALASAVTALLIVAGGVVGAETAGRNPVRMIESGPAAGALAACHYADLLGSDRLIEELESFVQTTLGEMETAFEQ